MNLFLAVPRMLRVPTSRRSVRGAARGFTMLELVLVAALSSVLFLILIRWVLTLGAASSVGLDNATIQRSADAARDAFADDVSNAYPCEVGESTVKSISPDKVTFSVRSQTSANGFDDITWQVKGSGGQAVLVRTFAASSGTLDPCAVVPTGTQRTFGDRVEPVQVDRIMSGDQTLRPAFYTVADGQTLTDPEQAWGSCAKNPDADHCHATSLGVNWLFRSPVDGGAPISVARSYTFATTGEGLN